MPWGRMSIASRSRSCDFRAFATAASASARLRTTSPTAATRRPLGGRFGLGFPGRPRQMIRVAADFSRFRVRGRTFGIGTPHSHSAKAVLQQVSEKTVSLGCDGGLFGKINAGLYAIAARLHGGIRTIRLEMLSQPIEAEAAAEAKPGNRRRKLSTAERMPAKEAPPHEFSSIIGRVTDPLRFPCSWLI